MAVELTRRLFDVDEYHRMAEVGILTDEDRVDLIDGEIVQMTPIGAPQLSVRLHRRTEPRPDVMLLHPPLARYARTIPGPRDVLLIVEVAGTSQYRDRAVKLPRYAVAGVPEVWIVDLATGVIDGHREPAPRGYRVSRQPSRGQEVASAAFPDVVLAVDDILG